MIKRLQELLLVLVSLSIVSCKNVASEHTKTPEELKAELRLLEETNPEQHLLIDAKMHDSIVKTREAGWFHDAEYGKDGNVIKGLIKNNASVAKFKDVVLAVTYYSATETEIKSEEYIFYEYYEPNTTKSFSLYVHAPDTMKSFNVSLKKATPVN